MGQLRGDMDTNHEAVTWKHGHQSWDSYVETWDSLRKDLCELLRAFQDRHTK
jgi:hypothetical protein